MRVVPFLLAVTAVAACTRAAGPDLGPREYSLAEARDSIPLAYQQPVRVEGVQLTLSRVEGDSRCPGGEIVCVWQGEAILHVEADPACLPTCARASSHLLLHTVTDPRWVDYDGLRIEAVGLLPAPRAAPIPEEEYVAWVRVTRVE